MTQIDATQDPEVRWLKEVYKRGAVQLTVRAVVTGMLLGAVMCLSNLYVVLKTGWSLGVTVTASILAFALFRALGAARIVRKEFSILENSTMASVASAAGFMTGGGNMAAVPALLMVTGIRPGTWSLVLWFAVIAAMGVFVAIPLKRQLVNIDRLPFPTGVATAETLQSLHHHGGEGAGKARYLLWSALIGGIVCWFRDAKAAWMPFNLPAHVGLPFSIRGAAAAKWTMAFDGSLILMGAGALMSFKTGWSLALGAVLNYGVLAPAMFDRGAIDTISYKSIVQQFTLWPAAAMLLSANLLGFAFQWRSVVRSFSGLAFLFKKSASPANDPVAEVECPPTWFLGGFLLLSPIAVAMMVWLFQIPLWAAILAIPLSLVIGVVASRILGETDLTPTKAMGPMVQLIFGALLPGNIVANIMTSNVTSGVGLHSGDLLTDLKFGYLLGANPRQQLVAQLFGCVAGAAIIVPAYNLLVPTADVLGTPEFPAPGVLVWAGVAKAIALGVSGLHPLAREAIWIGGALGIVLTLIERWAPRNAKPWIPSPSALGMAMVVPGFNGIAMGIGATIAECMRRLNPQRAERTVIPVASGFIAGESLMGIAIAVLVALGVFTK